MNQDSNTGLVKNYEVPESLTSLQANKLVCYGLMHLVHAGRRLGTLRSETKDSITDINNGNHSTSTFLSLCFYRMMGMRPRVTSTCSELSFEREKPELRKHFFFFFSDGH